MSRRTYLLIGTFGGIATVLYTFITVLMSFDGNLLNEVRNVLVMMFVPILLAYLIAVKKVLKYKDETYIKGLMWVFLVSFVSLIYTLSTYWFAIFPMINIMMYVEAFLSAKKAMKNAKN